MLSRFLMRADVAKLSVLDEPFTGIDVGRGSRMLAALGAQARAVGQVYAEQLAYRDLARIHCARPVSYAHSTAMYCTERYFTFASSE